MTAKTTSSKGNNYGFDRTEDVIGAIEKSLKLKHESMTCLVYLICDEPSHGKQYHDYPEGNDNGR